MPLEDFETFYATSYRPLVGQLYLLTGNQHDAEEIAQEAFVRAMRNWERIAGYDLPHAWVRRVALNLASNARLRAQRGARALVRHGPPAPAPAVSVDAVATAAALRQLPMRYRTVLVLHYMYDVSVSEIATEIGAPVGTVKARLLRGRRALAALLQDQDLDEGTAPHATR